MMRTKRPFERDETNADDAEIRSIASGVAPIAESLLDEIQSGALLEDYPSAASERWIEKSNSLDDATADIAEVLLYRKHILGDLYPFLIKGNALEYSPNSVSFAYEFLLAATRSQTLEKETATKFSVAFERVTGIAIKNFFYLTDSYRLGWPPYDDRPTSLADCATELNMLTREFIWSPATHINDEDGKRVKDGGVDIIAWRKFNDDRRANFFVFAQCACGDNWRNKLGDLDVSRFDNCYFRPSTFATPLKCMAIPRHVHNDDFIAENSQRAGLLFDRIRLIQNTTEPRWSSPRIGNIDLLEISRSVMPQLGRHTASGF